MQIIFFRSFVTAIFSTGVLVSSGHSLIGNNHCLLFLRSFFGIVGMTLFFYTIQTIPFGASVSLKYLSPFFAIILAIIFLKEKIRPGQWLFLVLAIVGVFLIKGFDSRIDGLSFTIALIGAFFGGCVYVTIRKIGGTEHPMVIINYYMLSTSLLSGIALLFYWETPDLMEFFLLILIGTIGFFGQKYMTTALQLEETNLVAPFKYSELIYAFLIGYIFFQETYDVLSLLGAFLLVASCLGNLIVKQSKE